MLKAIQVVNKEICRVITKAWAKGIVLGLDTVAGPEEPASVIEIQEAVAEWKEEINGLVKWLDWSVWHKCRPACGLEEMCYLPTWPLLGHDSFPAPGLRNVLHAENDEMSLYELRVLDIAEQLSHQEFADIPGWLDPQPSCVRRVAPYELGSGRA